MATVSGQLGAALSVGPRWASAGPARAPETNFSLQTREGGALRPRPRAAHVRARRRARLREPSPGNLVLIARAGAAVNRPCGSRRLASSPLPFLGLPHRFPGRPWGMSSDGRLHPRRNTGASWSYSWGSFADQRRRRRAPAGTEPEEEMEAQARARTGGG